MVSRSEIVDRLIALTRSGPAATYYLNGPPGAGKSHLLHQLASELPHKLPRSLVLGPYGLDGAETAGLGATLVRDMCEAGFVDGCPALAPGLDLAGAWSWIAGNAAIPPGQSFVILIDLQGDFYRHLASYASLFSAIRHLEGTWAWRNVRLLHVCAARWDPPSLEHYFDQLNTSFPYTVGHNYAVWSGVSMEDMFLLAGRTHSGASSSSLVPMLFEITAGHPAAALDVLSGIPAGSLSFAALLTSARRAALDGAASQALLESWCRLPPDTKSYLRLLILRRHLPATIPPNLLDRLVTTGLARVDKIGSQRYISFASWYVEMVARLHCAELGIADEKTSRIELEELVPQVSSLNVEAYRLIHDVESQVRNFLALHLCVHQAPHLPILQGRHTRYNSHTNAIEDAHNRALYWRARSQERGLPATLNPLTCYLSTRDLAELVAEVGVEIGSSTWQRIALALDDLAAVRDAVMHNQCIDELALQKLSDLQVEIYEALAMDC